MTCNAGRIFMSAVLVLSLLLCSAKSAMSEDYESYLQDLIREVLERNPDINKAREKKSASEHLVLPSGTLPDPQVGFSFSNFPTDTFDFDQEPMTSFDLFFTQKFPFPGKLSLKEEIAQIRSEQAGLSVAELENMLIFRTRRAYFRLYDISRATDITRKTRAILKEFLGVAQQRYAVGKALQQDVFRAQTAVSNINRHLFSLEKMRIEVIALINTLRAKQVDTEVTVPGKLSVEEIGYSEADLVGSAKESNPTLARLQLKVDEGEKGVTLARRGLYPDFALSARYRFREERADFLTGALTLTVPLYATKKQREIISSRKFELRSSENGYESYLNLIDFNVREIKSDLFSLKNRISLLDSAILPEARNTVESAMSAYGVGKLEFNSLVSAELALFKYELELSALMSKYNERVAELWMVIGKTLEEKEVSDE